jgi:hypothetical protein
MFTYYIRLLKMSESEETNVSYTQKGRTYKNKKDGKEYMQYYKDSEKPELGFGKPFEINHIPTAAEKAGTKGTMLANGIKRRFGFGGKGKSKRRRRSRKNKTRRNRR